MTADWPFTSHMVLQRNKPIDVSGTSKGDNITFDFLNIHQKVSCRNQHWTISLNLEEPGGPYTMRIRDAYEEIVLEDIYIGDVFIAAGQSNMEMKMHEAKHVVFDINHNVRFLHVPQYIFKKEGRYYPEFTQSGWQVLNKDHFEELSAVAYYFAENLDVDVPIGIIDNNRGGTSASCWVSEVHLKSDPELYQAYVTDYYKDVYDNEQQQLKKATDYYKKLYDYVAMFDEYRINHPEMSRSEMKAHVGHTPWPPPKGHYDFRRPCGLYYTMFLRTAQYPVKAVLWYQGEEDSLKPRLYERLLKMMIKNWREAYHDHVPFFIIQLPEFASDDYHFSKIRIIQNNVSKQSDNYLVPSLDCGETNNIHPTDKSVIGQRLADSVLYHLYHKKTAIMPQLIDVHYDYQQLMISYDQMLASASFKLLLNDAAEPAYTSGNKIICPIDEDRYRQIHTITYGDQNVPEMIVRGINQIPISPFKLNIK